MRKLPLSGRVRKAAVIIGLLIVFAGVGVGVVTTLAQMVPTTLSSAPGVPQPGPEIAATTTAAGSTSGEGPTSILKPNPSSPASSKNTFGTAGNLSASSPSGEVEFFTNMTLRVASPTASLNQAIAEAYLLGGYVAFSVVAVAVPIIAFAALVFLPVRKFLLPKMASAANPPAAAAK